MSAAGFEPATHALKGHRVELRQCVFSRLHVAKAVETRAFGVYCYPFCYPSLFSALKGIFEPSLRWQLFAYLFFTKVRGQHPSVCGGAFQGLEISVPASPTDIHPPKVFSLSKI